MKRLIIFTDLDGTLLDHYTYSFEKALPALTLLKEKNIPLVICSSKTRKEIEYYRRKLGNHHPFISENGGGIYIPMEYFKFQISNFKSEENGDYHVIRLGARYSDLRDAIKELQNEGFNVKGFGDMTVEELAEIANMSLDEASMAKERDFDEPFIFNGSERDEQKLLEAIISKGFNYTQGRFFHILGDSDKGKAVSILIDIYKKKLGEILTIAIGDSPNDIPMLEKVDYPIIVQKPDGSYNHKIDMPNLIKADGIGPDGWNKAILKFVSNIKAL
ncbi:MAG: HAD-IIB family hydrolase [Thermodesulfovibrionales bacterium]|jgi:mannosyl-3-phosphoglycerate phosphatase|nr:HAD-IIB family hydrolase [Thermodesulfovibrionales bacterium]